MAGYEIKLLEYYDVNGRFHKNEYSQENGRVGRTVENDERNQNGVINFTSLVFDAIKPAGCSVHQLPEGLTNWDDQSVQLTKRDRWVQPIKECDD